MNDYCAATEEVARDREDAERKITCSTLALWGEDFPIGGKTYDVAAIWRDMTVELRTQSIPTCGHLPREERPDQVNAALRQFLSESKS